jgi:tetratricopeptide (TPR) repeat protein
MMVKVLPTLIVMDIDKNRLHESKGYADVDQVLHYFEDLPSDVSFIYQKMEEVSSDTKNWKAVLDIALAYNDFAGNAENTSAKRSLYTASSHYFKKAGKAAKGSEADQEIVDIYETLSKAQRTNPEKAIKDLDKLYASSTGSNEDLFNYAYCCGFMLQGDLSKADSYYNKLTTSEGTEDLITKIDVLKETSDEH